MALGAGAVTIGAVHARPWQLELKDVMVGNAPGNWSVPMALHIGSAHWNFGTLGGLLSRYALTNALAAVVVAYMLAFTLIFLFFKICPKTRSKIVTGFKS